MSALRLWTRGIGVLSVSGLALARGGVSTGERERQPDGRRRGIGPAGRGAKAYNAVDTQTWRDKREKRPEGARRLAERLRPPFPRTRRQHDRHDEAGQRVAAHRQHPREGRARARGRWPRVVLTLAKGVDAKLNGEPIEGEWRDRAARRLGAECAGEGSARPTS